MKLKLPLVAIVAFCMAVTAQNGAYMEFKITSGKVANDSMKVKYSKFNMVITQMPGGGKDIKGPRTKKQS